MAGSYQYNVNLNIQANANTAKKTLAELSAQLTQLSQGLTIDLNAGKMTQELKQASQAAMELQTHLQNATNAVTGQLDFSKLNESIKKSGMSLEAYGDQLLRMGPAGQKAFASLATSISQAEVPLKRTNKLFTEMKTTLANTIKWQFSSSLLHGFMGSIQKAFSYAQDLNQSLTDIRIVTGQSSDQMAKFALQANKAAKSLSTSTTNYTKASLIYYQQGLTDKEVKERTDVTIKMANVTGQSSQKVSDQMTAVWNNFDNGSKSLSHYADVMTALGAATASSTDEIAQGLQKFAAISDTVGLSYEYAASALATVTSTTRESADVVGNAFKTLFSRIQGLQLGETLDDGTTLNKYSSALAKVGIQIKDSSGQMKNMDTILDEMGSKWETLANDERMALAQTVAGVRQYTQLMALMENWDYFKENLSTANTSTGTLEKQQKIYEESWAASNNRLRASFEGVWDSLINSQSFITFTDMLSNIVDMFNSITKALGGGGGVLSLLGVGLTKIFSKDLVRGINDITYGIKNLFGKNEAKGHLKDLQYFVTSAQKKFAVTNDNQARELFEHTPNMAAAFSQQIGNAAYMGTNFARFKDNLSPEDQAAFINRMNMIQQLDQQASLYASQYDEYGSVLADQAASIRREIAKKPKPEIRASKRGKPVSTTPQVTDQFLNAYLNNRRAYGAANELFGAGALENQVLEATDPQAAMKAVRAGVNSFWDAYGTKIPEYFDAKEDILKAETTEGMATAVSNFMTKLGSATEGAIPKGITGKLREQVEQAGQTAQQQGATGAKYHGTKDNTSGMSQSLVEEMQKKAGKASAGDIAVQGAQALMYLNTAITSLTSTIEGLSDATEGAKVEKIGSAISGLISTATTLAFGLSAISKIPAPIEVKVILGIIAAIVAAIPSIAKGIDKLQQSELESATEQALAMEKMYSSIKAHNETITKSISSYREAATALQSVAKGTTTWTEKLTAANKAALDLIVAHNLTSKDYYTDSSGQIQIKESALEQIEKTNAENLSAAELSKNLADNKVIKASMEEKLETGVASIFESAASAYSELESDVKRTEHTDEEGNKYTTATYSSSAGEEYDKFVNDNARYYTRYDDGEPEEVIDRRIRKSTVDALVKSIANGNNINSAFEILNAGIGANSAEAYVLAQQLPQLKAEALKYQESKQVIDLAYQDDAQKLLAEQTFKNAKILSNAGTLLQGIESKMEKTAADTYEKDWYRIAQDYAKSLGIDQNKGFKITDWGWDKNQIDYEYRKMKDDGTGYETISGKFEKDDLIAFEKGQITREELISAAENLDKNITTAASSGEEWSNALAAFVTNQNYTDASISELNSISTALRTITDAEGNTTTKKGSEMTEEEKRTAAQNILKEGGFVKSDGTLDIERVTQMATDSGFKTVEEYYDALFNRAISLDNLTGALETSVQGKFNNQDFLTNYFGKLNIADLQNLENIFTNLNKTGMGNENSIEYINTLTELMNSVSGNVDKGALLSELLKIDPTSTTAAASIIATIEAAGGAFDGGTVAAENFANALADIATPGLDGLITKLNTIKGLLNSIMSLEPGSNIDDAVYNSLIENFPALKGMFSKNALGGWTYNGSKENAQDIGREQYYKQGELLYNQQEWAKDAKGQQISFYNGNYTRTVDFKDVDLATSFRNNNYLLSVGGSISRDAVSNNVMPYEGFKAIEWIANGYLGNGIQQAAMQTMGYSEASQINDLLDNYYAASAAVKNSGAAIADSNADGIIDASDEGFAELTEEQQQAYNNLMTYQNQLTNMWAGIMELYGIDFPQAIADHELDKGSIAKDVDELGSLYGIQKQADGSYTAEATELNSAEDQMAAYLDHLTTMGRTYSNNTELMDKFTTAQQENNTEVINALLPQVQLSTAIGQVAAARGIDAETIAAKLEYMKQESDLSEFSIQQQAELAARYVEVDEGLDQLKANYSSLSQTLQTCNEGSNEWNKAIISIKQSLSKISGLNINQISTSFLKAAQSSGLLERAINNDEEALFELTSELGLYSAIMDKVTDEGQELALQKAFETDGMDGMIAKLQEFDSVVGEDFASAAASWNQTIEEFKTFSPDELLNNEVFQARAGQWVKTLGTTMGYAMNTLSGFSKAAQAAGFEMTMEPIGAADLEGIQNSGSGEILWQSTGEHGEGKLVGSAEVTPEAVSSGSMQLYRLKFNPLDGSGNSGGGGGGGGPKKVANKRKSQTVKRYKKNDANRNSAQSAKKSASTKKDYLYGESKIAQMEKINKLAEKEARITSDRIKESRKYMIEDRENLIKYMQKYGYEAEFDSDGFLKTYEDAWTQIHDKIAKLYEDNELTADEQKLEEDYKVELEELEGALEDYENSLKELQADIEAYEASLYEMYDNKVEQMQHKVEFKIELNEDDLSYLDFWIEALGDSLYNALESLQTMGQKTNVLFDGINTYKQGIEDIYALSDDPLHMWATGGLDEVLTQDQVDALRENRDGLMDYMKQLLDLRSSIQDKVLETFDKWQEKLNNTMSTIEHYSSVLEHFKNIIDIVGKNALGLSDNFMSNLQQNAVDQSMDIIDASKSHYDSLVAQNATAQAELEAARARGDQASIEHWENVVKQTTSEMQSAQDALLSSLESTLTMITEQFEAAMTQAVESFNDAIYSYGGLQGLSDDYAFMREQADLMAEDYDKIYQLSKINRNINKIMNDSSIVAGKQKMKALQQEINELQASGVELSKYDLEYLQAKYELRLAEIELENAQNNKDTVRLSRDSEGNWSYIYTASTEKVDEAQQKYEDALYAMQNLSYEYMDEMSNAMMQTSLQMMEEIQALRIQDFDSYDAYAAEIERIKNKYSEVLQSQEDELNKSMANNQDLYNKDWQSYSTATGYKISANQDWADNYYETTLGMLLGSQDSTSSFAEMMGGLSDTLMNDLGASAVTYFANVDAAMSKYGSSIAGFGSQVTSTVSNISAQSKTAAQDMKTMAQEMNQAFTDITEYVSDWQEEFSQTISDMLTEIGTLIQNINTAIQQSAELTGGKTDAGDLIGTDEAIEQLNNAATTAGVDLGTFEKGENGSIIVNGETFDNWVAYNGKLIEEIDKALTAYANTNSSDTEAREAAAEVLRDLFKKYHAFRDIVSRIYENGSTIDLESPTYTSLDTGGYTGEWGDSGKFAMLHEKELVLNADDTANFLDALNISRELINSMIELNAKQSSMGFGDLAPASFKDTTQSLEQQVSITAEFPNATDHNEIEEAFNNLINQASQYAHRYKI